MFNLLFYISFWLIHKYTERHHKRKKNAEQKKKKATEEEEADEVCSDT